MGRLYGRGARYASESRWDAKHKVFLKNAAHFCHILIIEGDDSASLEGGVA